MHQSAESTGLCKAKPYVLLWLALALLFTLPACNLFSRLPMLQTTQTALAGQQTELARTMAALVPAVDTPVPDLTAEPVVVPETQTGGETPMPPISPGIHVSPIPGDAPALDDRLLKSAKILLFEDMSASRYTRLVKLALDEAGYSYLDVGSAKGWFKTQLLSPVDWDLVIAAAEAEREFGGEFYEYLTNRVKSGSSVVIENWDLDAAPDGRAGLLLDLCGLQVQEDWYLPDLPVFYWVDPAHPLFNHPNPMARGLAQAQPIWEGDEGDLMQVKPGSQANPLILASLNSNWTTDHGLISTCLGGQVILQTFRSHQFNQVDMVALWQNYIFQTLKNRYERVEKLAPTPGVTYVPQDPPPTIVPAATPGPEYTFPHVCGGALTARITRAPLSTTDLFEHHANGIFIVLRLELENIGPEAVQIWDQDYFLESSVHGKPVVYGIQPAATGYLYIETPTRLWQDLVQPGELFKTALAFDIDPAAQELVFVLRPGSEFNQTVCEVRIPLTR